VKGIPLMPEFSTKGNGAAIRSRLRLEKQAFTVLLASGAFGIGRVHEIVLSTLKAFESFPKKPFNLMIVCGNNEELILKLNQIEYPANVVAKVFGFVRNMHELMDAANVLISKAGGLTSAEAMAKGLPIIIVDPIPGQESRNAEIIVEHGAGWQALDYHNLRYKLERIINEPALLQRAQQSTQALAKPKAAIEILEDVYSLLHAKPKPGGTS
jgi:processive 1,2-diacylglycerol beta-glucosyltransferase